MLGLRTQVVLNYILEILIYHGTALLVNILKQNTEQIGIQRKSIYNSYNIHKVKSQQ